MRWILFAVFLVNFLEIKGQLLVDITNGFDTKNDSSVGHGTPVQATNIISDGKLCDPNVQQHSGYVKFSGFLGEKSYFFWLLESRSNPSTDPLVVWLTGGPGCSSQMALLAENGPCWVNKHGNGTILNDIHGPTKPMLFGLINQQVLDFQVEFMITMKKEFNKTFMHFYKNFITNYPSTKIILCILQVNLMLDIMYLQYHIIFGK